LIARQTVCANASAEAFRRELADETTRWSDVLAKAKLKM